MNASSIDIKDKTQPAESFKISLFRKEVRKTTPHKHNNYFEIIYLSGGSGFHFIDSRKFEVTPPVIFFVRQEQTHHFDLSGEPDGFVAIIKKDFIQNSLDNELKTLLTKLSSQHCLSIGDNQTIDLLFQLLAKEYAVNSEQSFHIIEGLLKALLAKVLEIAKPMIRSSELRSDLYQSFLELLQAGSVVKNSVQFYAEQLNTTPQNLNAACRRAVDQASAEVLAEFITGEAKRLLLYTNNTVSQIAGTLDFIDASHFIKYFKRIIGQTPQAFRRQVEMKNEK
ncbi:DNA-binding protein [Niastella koreensis]|uniref:Transcriptional regulator, AraC family n=2 Tax=Niastella koreensis TaxID=354356 RepID=G8TC47_NIAKG|nr:helix-turn-helix transcriptional regulator [Niastella koreensis]AEW00354.1 transcriptional regulator, AraC family [Niastella koreensis GR20-10]OQP52222.1 DNA-binding protein [Niastella koreensis]